MTISGSECRTAETGLRDGSVNSAIRVNGHGRIDDDCGAVSGGEEDRERFVRRDTPRFEHGLTA